MAHAVQYYDINGDGKRDLIVGNYAGGLSFFSSKAPIGINELDIKEDEVLVFPNPANETINVRVPNNFADKITVEVYDVLGRNYSTQSSTTNSLKINCTELAKGIYFLKVITSTGKQSFTLIKKVVVQ